MADIAFGLAADLGLDLDARTSEMLAVRGAALHVIVLRIDRARRAERFGCRRRLPRLAAVRPAKLS